MAKAIRGSGVIDQQASNVARYLRLLTTAVALRNHSKPALLALREACGHYLSASEKYLVARLDQKTARRRSCRQRTQERDSHA